MAVLVRWAWRTPLGSGTDALDRVLAGASGVTSSPPDVAVYGIPRVGRIPGDPLASPDVRYLHRVARFGMEVAREVASECPPSEALGVFWGIGGLRALWDDLAVAMAHQREDGAELWANGLGKVHPYWMLRHLSNNAHALCAIALGARGEGTTCSGPCGGAAALAGAIRALNAGRLETAVVVGTDTLLQPEILLEGAIRGRWTVDDAGAAPGEAAVALLLRRAGDGPRISVWTGVDSPSLRPPGEPETSPSATRSPIVRAFGDPGAATALAQLVVLSSIGPGIHEAWSGGPPGLVARVEVRA